MLLFICPVEISLVIQILPLDAACREVLEETGVDTEPVGIVGFRHVLPQEDIPFPPFKCSDIYGKTNEILDIYAI